jgi:chromatin licensing and DNA replication factor 1
MARQETINKYLVSKKKRARKEVPRDMNAHQVICRELESNAGPSSKDVEEEKRRKAMLDDGRSKREEKRIDFNLINAPDEGCGGECVPGVVGEKPLDGPDELRTAERKERILQFARTHTEEIPNTAINIHLFLPKKLQKLARIYRVLQTIQKFNSSRGMTTIFIKSKDCMESLVKQRVEVSDIERMHYAAPEFFVFKKLRILHNEEEVDSFTIRCEGSCTEFDERLFEHVKMCHRRFLDEEGVDLLPGRFHPSFDIDGIPDLPRRPLLAGEEAERSSNDEKENKREDKANIAIEQRARERASTILERIREKERRRREEFIEKSKEEESHAALNTRMCSLFKSENKEAMPLSRVVEILRAFDGKEAIKRLVSSGRSSFSLRTISGTEYLLLDRHVVQQ